MFLDLKVYALQKWWEKAWQQKSIKNNTITKTKVQDL
jgi:hypothetical protein